PRDRRTVDRDIAADKNRQIGRLSLANHMKSIFRLLGLITLLVALGIERTIEHARAGENPRQAVVILRGNRIELVIMAAGTGDRKAQQAAADYIHSIFP